MARCGSMIVGHRVLLWFAVVSCRIDFVLIIMDSLHTILYL